MKTPWFLVKSSAGSASGPGRSGAGVHSGGSTFMMFEVKAEECQRQSETCIFMGMADLVKGNSQMGQITSNYQLWDK